MLLCLLMPMIIVSRCHIFVYFCDFGSGLHEFIENGHSKIGIPLTFFVKNKCTIKIYYVRAALI